MGKIYKYINTSNLPKKGKRFDWKNCVGIETDFIYGDISGKVLIENYENGILTISYKNRKATIKQSKFLLCQFGKLLQKITTEFKYDIGQRIVDDNRDITITKRSMRSDKSSNKKYKKYQYKCNICGFDCGIHYRAGQRCSELWTKESAITKGVGCSCCKNEITVNKINDIPTTTPWMIPYFQGGKEEAQKYSRSSNKKIYPICPNCNTVSKHKLVINDIYRCNGFGCACKDSFSMPEKFVYALLKQLNEDFVFYLSKTDFKWCDKYQYDFYLPRINCIIETHGMQHYERQFHKGGRTVEEEQKNDKIKEDLALRNGITNYIQLDCRYSTPDWLIDKISSSELSVLLDLKGIKWQDCILFASKSLSKEIIDYINNYEWVMIKDIAHKFKVSNPYLTILIKQAIKDGRIIKEEYNTHKHNTGIERAATRARCILVYDRNNNYLAKYESIGFLIKDSEEKFGCEFKRDGIYAVCNNTQYTHRGYIFKYDNTVGGNNL